MNYYVYRITNIVERKHYYGKRKTKKNPKNDLGYSYLSSSTNKEFIEDQKSNKSNYKYKIVKVYNNPEEASKLEIRLHNKFNVGVNPNFYNKVKQTSIKFDATGFVITPEHKAKISKFFKGRKLTQEHKDKIRDSKKYMTDATKAAISKAHRGKVLSDITKSKLREAALGRKVSKNTRDKLSKATCGENNPRAIKVNIFKYPCNTLVASGVICHVWCKDTEYSASLLLATLKRDINKPKCTNSRKNAKDRYNPLHHKNLYVKLAV